MVCKTRHPNADVASALLNYAVIPPIGYDGDISQNLQTLAADGFLSPQEMLEVSVSHRMREQVLTNIKGQFNPALGRGRRNRQGRK